jgi:hypothetical protein
MAATWPMACGTLAVYVMFCDPKAAVASAKCRAHGVFGIAVGRSNLGSMSSSLTFVGWMIVSARSGTGDVDRTGGGSAGAIGLATVAMDIWDSGKAGQGAS